MPDKQFDQLITIAPQSLIMLKTSNAEFLLTEVWFTDQNNKPLETEDNVSTNNLKKLIQMQYSFEPKYIKHVEDFGFLSLATKFGDKQGNKLMNTAPKTGRDAAKIVSKRVVQKNTAKATGDLIGNKIADKIYLAGKTKNRKEGEKNETNKIYIPPEKRRQIIDAFSCLDIV